MAQSGHDAMGSPTIADSPPFNGFIYHEEVHLPSIFDDNDVYPATELPRGHLKPQHPYSGNSALLVALELVTNSMDLWTWGKNVSRSINNLRTEPLGSVEKKIFHMQLETSEAKFLPKSLGLGCVELEDENFMPEEKSRQMEWPRFLLKKGRPILPKPHKQSSVLRELASDIALLHPAGKRSRRDGDQAWMPDEVVDNNEKLMSTLAPFFKKHVEYALEPILGPVASILRSQGEEEWKHQEKLFAVEERQLALRCEKIQLKRRRLGLSQCRRRASSTKPLRLGHCLKFPRMK